MIRQYNQLYDMFGPPDTKNPVIGVVAIWLNHPGSYIGRTPNIFQRVILYNNYIRAELFPMFPRNYYLLSNFHPNIYYDMYSGVLRVSADTIERIYGLLINVFQMLSDPRSYDYYKLLLPKLVHYGSYDQVYTLHQGIIQDPEPFCSTPFELPDRYYYMPFVQPNQISDAILYGIFPIKRNIGARPIP